MCTYNVNLNRRWSSKYCIFGDGKDCIVLSYECFFGTRTRTDRSQGSTRTVAVAERSEYRIILFKTNS